MAYTPFILTSTTDYELCRTFSGVEPGSTSGNLSDSQVLDHLPSAEIFITNLVAKQASNGVASAATIMGISGSDSDKACLKAAVAWKVVSKFAIAVTNAVNTSETTTLEDIEVTTDLGGVGSQWIQMRDRADQECDAALKQISGWKTYLEL